MNLYDRFMIKPFRWKLTCPEFESSKSRWRWQKSERGHSCFFAHLKYGHAVLSALSETLPSHQQKQLV